MYLLINNKTIVANNGGTKKLKSVIITLNPKSEKILNTMILTTNNEINSNIILKTLSISVFIYFPLQICLNCNCKLFFNLFLTKFISTSLPFVANTANPNATPTDNELKL